MTVTRRQALLQPLSLPEAPSGASAPFGDPVPAGLTAHAIRASNTLLFQAEGRVLHQFRAAFGREAGGKRLRDDERTPIGDYLLHPARASAQWRWFLAIDYPNADDIVRGRSEGLTRGQLGDAIGVHGFGDWPPIDLAAAHGIGWNWTAGCISVSYPELEIVRALVQRPIPIRIEG
ncbi:MAG: hypothetical protein FJX57_09310 [Alphaproteobacteria bacterium]|nr:hypothetical protein [Alphaproteobacteria bacterium]